MKPTATHSHKRSSAPPQDTGAWFAGRLPDGWFTSSPAVTVDRDEILVVGTLAQPKLDKPTQDPGQEQDPHASSEEDRAQAAARARIQGFREDTRTERMRVAAEAEHLFGRKVSWGARCGEDEQLFTTAGVPVMTRLRMSERAVLDTLIDAGVARSRSEALAWCVRLVGRHQSEWIDQLREALDAVERVRADGPPSN